MVEWRLWGAAACTTAPSKRLRVLWVTFCTSLQGTDLQQLPGAHVLGIVTCLTGSLPTHALAASEAGLLTPEVGPELSQPWHIWRMKARPSMQKACTAASTLFRQMFSTRKPWLAGLRSFALTCKPPLPQAC